MLSEIVPSKFGRWLDSTLLFVQLFALRACTVCRHTWALFVVECRNTYESAHLSLANLYGTLPMGTL